MLLLSLVCALIFLLYGSQVLIQQYQEKVHRRQSERLQDVRQGLAESFFFLPRQALPWVAGLLILGGGTAGVFFSSIWPPLLGFTASWMVPIFLLHLIRRRRKQKFLRQFGNTLPQLSSVLHAGHTFERALESLASRQPSPLREEFGLVLKELRLGTPLHEAMTHLGERMPSRDLDMVVRAISISRRVGSNVAEAFDRVAEMIRARQALADRLAGLTAQGRMQAWIALVMPLALSGILQLIAPGHLRPLFTTQLGQRFLIGGAILLIVGGVWVRKIARTEVWK